MADQTIFENTLNPMSKVEPFKSKEIPYILDQNSGSYNGQILIDASSLSNSGKWLNWNEAELVVPYQIALQSNVSLTATAYNGFEMGMKNGFYQIVDSIQVDFNNTNVVQLQPFTNMYVNYKVLTTWSSDDLAKNGATLGVAPDTGATYSFSAAGLFNGDGLSNNVVNPAATIAYATQMGTYNAGFLKRLQSTAFPLSTAQAGIGSIPTMTSKTYANQIGKSYFSDNAGSGSARVYYWSMLAVIRLKDLCGFFEKVPLMKNSNFRFTINYNSSYGIVNGVTTTSMIQAASPTMLSGRTNPVMIASAATSNPMAAQIVTGQLTYSCGVAKTVTPASTNAIMSSCRLYVPAYQLQALDDALVGESAERIIEYDDIFNYNILGVTTGSSVNQILTNGLVNPKSLVVMPMLNSSTSVNSSAFATSPYQSPFDSCPGTLCPLASLSNFQVQVSGSNIFINNVQYDFDMFLNEVAQVNAINGNQTAGLTSGLISQADWESAYSYYVCNIARRIPQNDSVPLSISLVCSNNTATTLDLFCWITFTRKIAVNILTGSTRLVAQ